MGKIQFWNIGPAPGSCPYAQRTWIALEEKKLDYDIKLEDKANKSKEWDDLYHGIWTYVTSNWHSALRLSQQPILAWSQAWLLLQGSRSNV